MKMKNMYRSLKSVACEDKAKCKDCIFTPLCNISCPSATMQRFNNFDYKSITQCDWDRTLLDFGINILNNNNPNLIKYCQYVLYTQQKESEEF